MREWKYREVEVFETLDHEDCWPRHGLDLGLRLGWVGWGEGGIGGIEEVKVNGETLPMDELIYFRAPSARAA